jgi:ring-1,2-phenylacetyl-CoA epoxidase subunit PaaC
VKSVFNNFDMSNESPSIGFLTGNLPSAAAVDYLFYLADSALILSQRNSEWCGHGPVLEQDIAITNISLDLLGQARNFYQHAATIINQTAQQPTKEITEDDLAFLRSEREFKNLLLVEQPNGDWAQTILRQYFFSQFQLLLYRQLQNHNDPQIAAIAAKSVKETTYHVRWSGEWVIRLGDGTEESHNRMETALDELWAYTGELFVPADYEKETGIDLLKLKEEWLTKVKAVFAEATLALPAVQEGAFMQIGGKEGRHTEYLGYILAEMQYLQRAYPDAKW